MLQEQLALPGVVRSWFPLRELVSKQRPELPFDRVTFAMDYFRTLNGQFVRTMTYEARRRVMISEEGLEVLRAFLATQHLLEKSLKEGIKKIAIVNNARKRDGGIEMSAKATATATAPAAPMPVIPDENREIASLNRRIHDLQAELELVRFTLNAERKQALEYERELFVWRNKTWIEQVFAKAA